MKEEKAFTALIYYIVFIFFKKIFDLFISITYPDQETILYENNNVEIKKIIIRLRTFFSLLSLFWLIYLVKSYKFNTNIYLILLFIFLSNLFYLLFEKRVIYYIFDKEQIDPTIIETLDLKGGIVINIIYFFIYSYLIYKIFAMNQ